MDLKKLRVNGKRLRSTLEQMAKIGGTPGGGVQRLSLSDEDKQARDLFIREPYLVKHIKEGKTKTASFLSCNKCLAALVNDIPVKCYHKGLPE